MTAASRRPERFAPRAAREMASMFDQVSPRYDLLNRLMTLGRDASWRRELARAVPERAVAVMDLCTGSGASLAGLRRPGRLVVGVDVSLSMLEHAADVHGGRGWAPRLACADAFRLPLRGESLDAVTIAFGARNLRPREAALGEIARVLRPGGVLAVLEATAPRAGPLAPLHRFHLRRVLPLLGRLSPEPDAYRYLGESILEFGAGPEFEAALEAAHFVVRRRRSFLLGAARLWVATLERGAMQGARSGGEPAGELPQSDARAEAEHRAWTGFQLLVSVALLLALVVGLQVFFNPGVRLPLEPPARSLAGFLLIAGTLFSLVRTVLLALRFFGPPPER